MKNRIKELRKKKKLTLTELASEVGVAMSTMSNYELGNREPNNEMLLKLAEFFDVSVDYLICRDDYSGERPISTGGKWIPVLGTIAAGIPLEAVEDILDWEEIPHRLASTGEFFALKIKGDSMSPTLVEDEVVIIRKQPDVESGDIAAVIVNNEEATIKRVKKQLGGMVLAPSNPEYSPIYFTNKEIEALPVQILGKVVESRKRF